PSDTCWSCGGQRTGSSAGSKKLCATNGHSGRTSKPDSPRHRDRSPSRSARTLVPMTSGRLWWPPVDDATVADCLRGLPGPHPGREFPFNAGPWRRWLADRHPAASAVVADLADSGSVRRADLVTFAANADGADGLLRLF